MKGIVDCNYDKWPVKVLCFAVNSILRSLKRVYKAVIRTNRSVKMVYNIVTKIRRYIKIV